MSLDSHTTIHKLIRFNDSPSPILSIYLEIPYHTTAITDNLLKLFNDLVELSLDSKEIDTFSKELESVKGYLEQYKYTQDEKGLAFFVGGNNLWEVVHTKGKATTSLVIKHSPNLNPLLEEEKHRNHYLIILADRAKAQFFLLHDGSIEDTVNFHDIEVPQKIKEKGTDKSDGHFRDQVHKHYIMIGKKAEIFTKDKPIAGIIIGGHKASFHDIERNLPKHMQDKIVGKFISELNISRNEVFHHASKLLKELDISFPHKAESNHSNP